VIQFPNIDPVLVEIGPFAIRWYALSYILGIGLSYAYALRLLRRSALWGAEGPVVTQTQLDDFLTWLVLGVILGGRIGYVLFYNLPYYIDNPIEALIIWRGGMSFHGGTIGVVTALLLFGYSKRVDPMRLADLIAPAVPISIASVRSLGNFINGELYGRTTDVPWAIVFPHGGPLPRHPSQLYEAALEGVLLFFILRWLAYSRGLLARRGALTGAFLIGYGLLRTVGEFFREPDRQIGFLIGGLTMGMLLSVPMIAFGVVFLMRGTVWPPVPKPR
jgi:phosphatidylglycerol:prolipoprotein diacylglycerol transferase